MNEFWTITLIETIAVTLIGSLLHFVFEWSHRNRLVAVFAAVNESTWEHVKLALSGLFACTLVDLWFLGDNPNYWLARTVSFLVPVIVIPLFFAFYKKVLKVKSLLPLDIELFVAASALASMAFAGLLQAPAVGQIGGVISVIAGVVVLAAYLLLTRFPLKIGLFRDPISGRYGLAARPRSVVAPAKSKHSRLKAVMLALGLLAFVGLAVGGVAMTLKGRTEPEPEVIAEPEPEPDPEPVPRKVGPLGYPTTMSEAEKQLAENYEVAADLPRVISIPAIQMFARVTTVGKVNGAVGTPADLRMVAWYNLSQLPGQPGASLMDGHGGNTGRGYSIGNGIMNELVNAKIGDEIFIEMGDRETRYVYKVVEVLWLTKGTQANNYMKTALKTVETGEPTLTLITCAGDWISAEKTFTHRVFVRAVLEYE